MRTASGRLPHSSASSATASGSARTRSGPMIVPTSAAASSRLSAPSQIQRPDSSPTSARRHVITMRQPVVRASSGRSWVSSAALSSRIMVRRPASNDRNSVVCSSTVSGICSAGTPSARSRMSSATRGVTGWSSIPRRSTEKQPSGNSSRSSYAAVAASAVLPTPGCPTTDTTTPPGASAASRAAARSRASSSARPTRSGTALGSGATTPVSGAGRVPRWRPWRASSRKRKRSTPARPSASASASVERRCAALARPRSRSERARTLTPEASARSA